MIFESRLFLFQVILEGWNQCKYDSISHISKIQRLEDLQASKVPVSSRKRAFPLVEASRGLAILHSFNVRKTRPVLLSISSTWRSVSGTIAANDRGELAAQKFADKASRDPSRELNNGNYKEAMKIYDVIRLNVRARAPSNRMEMEGSKKLENFFHLPVSFLRALVEYIFQP